MTLCLFVTDLHGSTDRFAALFALIRSSPPDLVLLGGDILPFAGILDHGGRERPRPFIAEYLAEHFASLRRELGDAYPLVGIILGNDDPRCEEQALQAGEHEGLWYYLHGRKIEFRGYTLYGYSCIPPSPFMLKDWERYDVSRYVDVGASAPGEGWRSVPGQAQRSAASTIQEELEELAGKDDLGRSVFLFHSPPYSSYLDRADLDGQTFDSAPLDVHVGSIAVGRFIEQRRPYITLHGHVHESARLSGHWKQRIGRTWCLSAAHEGPELAVVRFTLENPGNAERGLFSGPGSHQASG